MIVEDNFAYREMFKDSLSYRFPSMKVTDASNGKEAFKWLAAYPFDLVLMDIKLPGENGLDLTRKIKAKYKDVTIALLTSYDLTEYQGAAARSGADGFIAKSSMKWDEVSTMVECLQRAKDTGGLKPACLRLSDAADGGIHSFNM